MRDALDERARAIADARDRDTNRAAASHAVRMIRSIARFVDRTQVCEDLGVALGALDGAHRPPNHYKSRSLDQWQDRFDDFFNLRLVKYAARSCAGWAS
jgi:hypothetical protein